MLICCPSVYTPNGVKCPGGFAFREKHMFRVFDMSATSIPDKLLLPLHAACESRDLWSACCKLLDACFENHFLAIGYSFQGNSPMVIKRTKPAPERDADWWARNAAMHPLTPKLLEEPFPKIMRTSDFMTLEEVKSSEYYKEFMIDEEWVYSVGMFIRDGARVIGMTAVNRREDQGDFTEEEMEQFQQLYPHFEIAFRRVAKIQDQSSASLSMATMLGRLPLAVAILGWNGETTYINDAARQACIEWEHGDGLDGRSIGLAAAEIPEAVKLACSKFAAEHEAQSTLNSPASFNSIAVPHPSAEHRQIIIEPLVSQAEPLTKPSFLIRFHASDYAESIPELKLQLLSVLTTAEKAVAELMIQGQTNREVAEKLGKSEGTVKKQAESIYKKLGLRDRRQLMLTFQVIGDDSVEG